jgi:hypothetical protein
VQGLFEKAVGVVCFLEIFVLFLFKVEKREAWVEESSMILDKTQKILKKKYATNKKHSKKSSLLFLGKYLIFTTH